MRGIAKQQMKQRGQSTGRRARGKPSRSSGSRRRRNPRPPRIDTEQLDPSETATIPVSAVNDLSRFHEQATAIQGIALPSLEQRLRKRYLIMVQSHLRSAPELAAGVASLPSLTSAPWAGEPLENQSPVVFSVTIGPALLPGFY